MSFEFPSFYNFPPFFTLQPIRDSLTKQLNLWSQFILDYCKHHTLFTLNISQSSDTELFHNTSINRRLSPEAISQVFSHLISQERAEWLDSNKETLLIFFKSPDEWASIVTDIITSSGNNNSICTLYELRQGSLGEGTPLHNVPHEIILKAVDVLVNRGQATLIEEETLDEYGVKFDIK
ncbi:hypothetical protein P9112_000641 [Eukaryota sp. TZLM1-RC]